jgi:hypothetical protein
MEPITLILTALAEGAKASAGVAIKDAYNGLKTLIQRKFSGKPVAEMALTQHEAKPEVWEAPLKEALTETSADQDPELVTAAQKLMELANPQQAAVGKYNVQITGNVQGVVAGDNAKVEMNFGGEKPKET